MMVPDAGRESGPASPARESSSGYCSLTKITDRRAEEQHNARLHPLLSTPHKEKILTQPKPNHFT